MSMALAAASASRPAHLLSDDPGGARPPESTQRAAGAPAPTERSSILVVDDDESIRDMVAEVLLSAGYSVRSAGDGESALALLEVEHPALVLLDMRLPKVDGWEFARRLKGRGVRVPILVMTAFHDAARAADEIGADGYISKPFEIDELLMRVSRHIERPPN